MRQPWWDTVWARVATHELGRPAERSRSVRFGRREAHEDDVVVAITSWFAMASGLVNHVSRGAQLRIAVRAASDQSDSHADPTLVTCRNQRPAGRPDHLGLPGCSHICSRPHHVIARRQALQRAVRPLTIHVRWTSNKTRERAPDALIAVRGGWRGALRLFDTQPITSTWSV
jgi:hypothetical protein